jgi:hypothetical protein
MNDLDDRDATEVLDVLLREHVGGDSPPDLRAAVLRRLQRGEAAAAADRVHPASVAPGRATAMWLAAALVVLGAFVVGATWWFEAQRRDAATPPQAPAQDPSPSGRAAVRIRVQDVQGGPVVTFVVDLVRADANVPSALSKLPGFARRPVSARDVRDDFALLDGLPAGRFVAIVTADAHAPTRSEPFDVTAAGPPPEVTIRLQRGSTLRGVVHGADGKPLAGARVRTAAPTPAPLGTGANAALAAMLTASLVMPQTLVTTTTAADGTYELRHLAAAAYEVHVEHRDFCEGWLTGLHAAAPRHDLATVQLRKGARIRGRALAGDQGIAGVEITLCTAADTAIWKTTSDAEGHFELPHRVPPGAYRIFGTPTARNDNPFAKLLEIRESERSVVVAEGADAVEQDVPMRR